MRIRRRHLPQYAIIAMLAFLFAYANVPLRQMAVSAVHHTAHSLIQAPAIAEEPQPTPVWPLAYTPQETIVTSEFSLSRKHPTSGVYRPHNGIDLGCSTGTPLLSAESGTVIWITDPHGLGNAILIIGDRTGTEFLYAHADTRVAELENKWVAGGTQIGACGSTGASTGPHLHFELIINNVEINPREYLELLGLNTL